MNNFKNKLLVILALTSTTFNIMPHGGGGGFGGGLATGMVVGGLTGAAIASSNRDRGPEYYEYKREKADQARADRLNRRLDTLHKRLDKAKTPESKTRIQKEIDRVNNQLDTL